MIHEHIERIITPYAAELGKAFLPYKNHVHRVGMLTLTLLGNATENDQHKIAIVAVYHDLGIWTGKTFDYLQPSIGLVYDHLAKNYLTHWADEIEAIIDNHHKLSTYQGAYASNVEAFRRADLIDLTKGLISFGLTARTVKALYTDYPMLGFRRLLLRTFFRHILRHPLDPLPMVKR